MRDSGAFYKSAAFHSFLVFLFLMYIPQYLFHWYFVDYFEFLYFGNEQVTLYPIVFLILLAVLVFIAATLIPKINITIQVKNDELLYIFKKVFITGFIAVFLLISLKFSFDYGIDFRHKNRISEAGPLVALLFFLRFVAVFYVFYIFTRFLREQEIFLTDRVSLALIAVALSLTVTSSLGIPVIVVAVILVLMPQRVLNKLFFKGSNFLTLKFFFISLLSVPLVVGILFLGFANKWGVEVAFEFFKNSENWMLLASKIFTRISTSYASINAFISSGYLFDIDYQIDAFVSGFQTFISRLGMVTGLFSYTLESIESVNRMNFELLFNTFLPRAGTSPGPIASTLYIPFFPVNFIIMALYIGLMLRFFERYVPVSHCKLSVISKLFLAYFMLPFLESPLNLFAVINPVVIYVLLFIFVTFFIKSQKIRVR